MPQPKLTCHCGAIRLEVDAELAELIECNRLIAAGLAHRLESVDAFVPCTQTCRLAW